MARPDAQSALGENELFLLSYYRTSEIAGSLFFGRLARVLRPGPIQHDMTRHFADEAQHAWYWTRCLDRMGARALKLSEAYQDGYLEAAGVPANLMEVLAATLVFERRVTNQYARHRATPALHPEIGATIDLILHDERRHVRWVSDALAGMEARYGASDVAATLRRYREADRKVHGRVLDELAERLPVVGRPR